MEVEDEIVTHHLVHSLIYQALKSIWITFSMLQKVY